MLTSIMIKSVLVCARTCVRVRFDANPTSVPFPDAHTPSIVKLVRVCVQGTCCQMNQDARVHTREQTRQYNQPQRSHSGAIFKFVFHSGLLCKSACLMNDPNLEISQKRHNSPVLTAPSENASGDAVLDLTSVEGDVSEATRRRQAVG